MQIRPWELAHPPSPSDSPSPAPSNAESNGEKTSRRISMSSNLSARKADIELVNHFEHPVEVVSVSEDPTSSPNSPSSSHHPAIPLGAILTDGYRDSWDMPSSQPSPLTPLQHPESNPPQKADHGLQHHASKFSVLPRRPPTHSAPYAVPQAVHLSTRARVFGPERVVLDPRIRAVHKRVLRDILASGVLSGTVLTVVVLVLPPVR